MPYVQPREDHRLAEGRRADVVAPHVIEMARLGDADAGALGQHARPVELPTPLRAAARQELAVFDQRLEVLPIRNDVRGDLRVRAPRSEAHAPIVGHDHRGRGRLGRQEHAPVHHHAVVAVLVLKAPLKAPTTRLRILGSRGIARAMRAGERLGIFDARLHVELELAHVHRHQEDLGVGRSGSGRIVVRKK